jgi:ATPase subunit of ABC transporter with duplicated ATPase domains
VISVSNLEKSFGEDTLFRGASFQLNAGCRYGLVGANGSGKTTLLNILAGELEASAGEVSVPGRARLGVLRQDQFLYEDERILGVVMMGNPELWRALVEHEEVLARAADYFDAERYTRLEETIQRYDGYAAESRAAAILEGLGLPAEVHQQPLRALSGGFKLRVLLARALAGSPDALLLDEPTNHLDILSIRWLERFLRAFAGPVVVISHDHRFLDNVATHILDVDYETVTLYTGDYSAFMAQKSAERERRERDIESREKEIAHHQKFVDRFRAKATKARQAQSKLRLIEKKVDELEPLPPSSRRWPTFRFREKRHSGRDVLELRGIRKSFGGTEVLHGVDIAVRRGDRLAVIGPNGIGKSTLLKIAVGEMTPDAGEAEWGYATDVGYFAQDHKEHFEDADGSVEGYVMSGDAPNRGVARAALGALLFTGDDAEKPLAALSGGEAARLEFCRLGLERPNVLVLDEPTNHLDLESIEALVAGLERYDGTLILVSHDRWFVGRLATRIVEVRRDGIRDYPGTYEEYVHACGDDHLDVDRVMGEAKDAGQTAGRRRRSDDGAGARTSGTNAARRVAGRRRPNGSDPSRVPGLEQRRDALMAEIDEAEARIAGIEQAFCDPGIYDAERVDEVYRLDAERTELGQRVERLMREWEAAEKQIAAESS